jgi:hypothetical protein
VEDVIVEETGGGNCEKRILFGEHGERSRREGGRVMVFWTLL